MVKRIDSEADKRLSKVFGAVGMCGFPERLAALVDFRSQRKLEHKKKGPERPHSSPLLKDTLSILKLSS
jgi:hypothetical protein